MPEKPGVYNPEWGGLSQIQDLEVQFINPKMRDSLAKFNPIIVFGSTLLWVTTSGGERTNEAVKREREIFNALENGSAVCLVFNRDPLFDRILQRIDVRMATWEEPRTDFVIKRSEFSSFLKRFGSARYYFYGDLDDVICETKEKATIGFAKKVGKGVLIILPSYSYVLSQQLQDAVFMDSLLTVLLKELGTYLPKIHYKPPNFVKSYRFPVEANIMSEMQRFQQEIDRRKKSVERYMKLKEILWLRDNELVDSVMNFLEAFGIKSKRDEVYEEDFWITEGNKETVIVEVKGLDKNVTRPHLSKLDEHRGAREKPDDFPALLIANTFNKADSLTKKDMGISPNEIKKAVRTNILILRTLDLCNAYTLKEKAKLDGKTLLNILKTENGWLHVTESGYEVKRNREVSVFDL